MLANLDMTEVADLMQFMTQAELADLDNLLSATEVSPWEPLPGPQTEALHSEADITFYGGAAGGGKTDLLLGAALLQHHRSIIFRREFAQLKGIRERAEEIYGEIGKFNGGYELWRINEGPRAGTRIEFGASQFPGDESKYQGRAHDLKAFDEITHFTEQQFRFLITWNRTTRSRQRTRVIAAGNPPTDAEGDWVIRYWAPWLDPRHPNPAKPGELRWFVSDPINGGDIEVPDGKPVLMDDGEGGKELVKPKSRTFIFARVEDNPHLMATGYKAILQALPEPLRSRMLKGNFGVGTEDAEWQVIPTAWVIAAQARWEPTYEAYMAKMSNLKDELLERKAQALMKEYEVATSEEPSEEGNPSNPDPPGPSTSSSPPQSRNAVPAMSDMSPVGQETYDERIARLEKAIPGLNGGSSPAADLDALGVRGASGVDIKAVLGNEDVVGQQASTPFISEVSNHSRVVGVDAARGGRAKTVVTERIATWFNAQISIPGSQTPDGQSIIQALVNLGFTGVRIQLDVAGIGSSPVDIGRLYKMNIIPMNGTDLSTAKDRSGKLGFYNARAEYYWKLREDLDPALGLNLAIPPDPELLADLTAPRWSLTRRGILVEPKEKIQKRIMRSTDKGDSLVNAHATPHVVAEGFLEYMRGEILAGAQELQDVRTGPRGRKDKGGRGGIGGQHVHVRDREDLT